MSDSVLHSESQALSWRHGPSWLLLALAAGAANAGAFLVCERFIASVTSTASRVGLNVGAWTAMAEYLMLLGAFVMGAMLSVLPVQARLLRGKRALYAVPLLTVSGVLTIAALAGQRGAFGELGVRTGDAREFVLLCSLALAMGLMNATVSSSTELSLRATHMTGQATDFGVHLVVAWWSRGPERARELRLALLRGGKLVAFSLGAVLMVPSVQAWGYLAFLLPALLVLLATLNSYVRWPRKLPGPGKRASRLRAWLVKS
jgi:uncharacterized membrane protein YoaK (UPF0700 family)